MSRLLPLLALTATLTLAACGGDPAGDGAVDTTATIDSGTTISTPPADAPADTNTGTTTAATSAAKMNINTATEDQMRTIPGVGDKMVHEFEEYRPYRSIVQFRKEIGKYVDTTQVATYENYIYVPIDPNESDMETLAQIPGLDMSEANMIVTGRPYASPDAFFEKLTPLVDPQGLTVARTYVTTN